MTITIHFHAHAHTLFMIHLYMGHTICRCQDVSYVACRGCWSFRGHVRVGKSQDEGISVRRRLSNQVKLTEYVNCNEEVWL